MKDIEKLFADNFKGRGITLDIKRKELRFRSIMVKQKRGDYGIAFANRNVKTQEQLNYINNK